MALSPEARFSDFKDSVKKYLVDNLETTNSIKLFFNWIEDVPVDDAGVKLTKWIIITFGDFERGSLAECYVELNLFTRKDFEGDDMATLYDLVMDYFLDESETNGLKEIPYYDTSGVWTKVGGIVPLVNREFATSEAKDNTKIKTLHLLCKWGSK